MHINSVSKLSFSVNSSLKSDVEFDAYTGKELSRRDRTIDHIVTKSRGGRDEVSNYLVTAEQINHDRGNTRLDVWLKHHLDFIPNIQKYLDRLKGKKLQEQGYVKEVTETLNREARGVAHFTGNRLDCNC